MKLMEDQVNSFELNKSSDMPSSISSAQESNQSFEEQAQAAQEFFPQAVTQALYFPPLQQVQQAIQQPSINELNELAQVTRCAGGVKPLHQTYTPTFTAFQPIIESAVELSSQDAEKKAHDFKFPDGGWECSKCQNYNFKGRKECHRCKKSKCDDDNEGMPTHLTMSPNQRADAKKKGLLKNNKKVESNIAECEDG
jgi:hypothetical protein